MTHELILQKESQMIMLAEKIPSNSNTYQFKHYYDQDIYFGHDEYDKLKYLDLMEKTMKQFHKSILIGKSFQLENNENNKNNKIWKYVFDDFEEWCHYKGYKTKCRDTGSTSGLFEPSGIKILTVFVPEVSKPPKTKKTKKEI